MSGRNRGLHPLMKDMQHTGLLPTHEPTFKNSLGRMPYPTLLEEIRESQFGMSPRALPPHPAIIEEHLAAQYEDIQGLLTDNQGLSATHVALMQEIELVQYELDRMSQYAHLLEAEMDMRMREMYDKSAKLEMDLGRVDVMKTELKQVCSSIKELSAVRQDLMGQVQLMTQDLAKANGDLQQVPSVNADIDALRLELQRAKAAIEYEKKGYAENYEHGQAMEKKLVTMARELENLRGEIASSGKRAHAVAAVSNFGSADYGNTEVGYPGDPYHAGYGINPELAASENYSRYGPGSGMWGVYDVQKTQGHR